ATQAPARHQERDRLDQIGFAGAVWPGEHDETGPDVEVRRVVAAEVGQRQAAERGGGHGVALKQRRLGLKAAWVSSGPSSDKRYTRIGMRTWSEPLGSLSSISVGEPGSARRSTATSPSSWAAMSSR